MNVQDMLPFTAKYTVTHQDGTQDTFDGPLFMLWAGLHEFLQVIYPDWVKIDYNCEGICCGTIKHQTSVSIKPL